MSKVLENILRPSLEKAAASGLVLPYNLLALEKWSNDDLRNVSNLLHEFRCTVDLDAEPSIPEGWKLESHLLGGKIIALPSNVRLHIDSAQEGHHMVSGRMLRKNIGTLPVINATLLDWYLQNQKEIPEEWKFKRIFFWGTIYRLGFFTRAVRYLYWYPGGFKFDWGWVQISSGWRWGYYELGDKWGADCPALVHQITPSK